MYLFDNQKKLKAYSDPREIIDEFYEIRLDLYESRLEKEIHVLEAEIVKLKNQIRFINSVVSKNIELNLLTDENVEIELENRSFDKLGSIESDHSVKEAPSFNYLLRMPLLSLTSSNSLRLSEQLRKSTEKLGSLKSTDIKDLWLSDLDVLEKKLKKMAELN
jgi:DNA topoisomerase-2